MIRRLVCLISLLAPLDAFLLGVDLGSQYLKAAVVAPGKPFEVVLNQHSKRKSPTAVSFQEAVRTFGDDAVMSGSKNVGKTPMLFPMQLGRNLSGVPEDQLNWLSTRYYPYNLGVNESGSILFKMGGDDMTVEEVAAHLLSFAKGLAMETVDGASVSETVLTVPSPASMQKRRALLTAAKIAGLPRPQLIHETSAAALQRALDVDLGGAGSPAFNGSEAIEPNRSNVLFYNMGARHVEACVVNYEGASYQGKNTVAMNVLGCGVSEAIGGHQVDVILADKMLAAFKEKHPKLADIEESGRALKKLEKQALATKHVLSANKEAQFRVESLYEDTDFMKQVTREELGTWSKDVFDHVSEPIKVALAIANVSLEEIDGVEMIGGGWRIPQIQTLVSEYIKAQRSSEAPILNLSQHVNGDEAMATGAAFYGANSSISFRTKKIFFTDSTLHGYAIILSPLNTSQPHEEGWVRGVDLFPEHGNLRAKKTVKLNATFDLKATLLENGNPVSHLAFAGIHDAVTGQYAKLETPLISLKFELDGSGVVQVSSAQAIFDEPVEVEVKAPKGDASNTSTNSSQEKNSTEEDPSKEDETEAKEETPAESNTTETANATDIKQTKIKIMKRKVSLSVVESFDGVVPRPLVAEEIDQAVERLRGMEEADAEVRKTEAAKNALESYIYESREKIGSDEGAAQVSTEDDRSAVSEKLTAMEDWLYEDEARDANATLLTSKIEELEAHVRPILKRAWEMEQRAQLPELIQKIRDGANQTLEYVIKNMTWVAEKETTGVAELVETFNEWYANVTELQEKKELTEEPAYEVLDVKRRLDKIRSEAVRLTKIKKIDPMPYSSDYGKYGDYWKDPKMREFYEQYYKNFSRNGSNSSDYFRNFNFSNFNNSANRSDSDDDYMKSFRNFYGKSNTSESAGEDKQESTGAEGADGAPKTESEGKSEL